jgi:predicted DNA binding protein
MSDKDKDKDKEKVTAFSKRDLSVVNGGRPRGWRPNLYVQYSEDIAKEIILRIIEGETAEAICRDKDMPHISAFYLWKEEIPEFSILVKEAERKRAETVVDLIIKESAMSEMDTAVESYPKAGMAGVKLRMDNLKWWAAKNNPQRFGDFKMTESHVLKEEVHSYKPQIDYDALTDEQLEVMGDVLKKMLDKAGERKP